MVHGRRRAVYLKQIWPFYVIVLAAFGLGIIFGAGSASTLPEDKNTSLQGFIGSALAVAADLNPDRHQIAAQALGRNLFGAAAIYLCGLTIIGLPFILAFVFSRGFTMGFTVGFLFLGVREPGVSVAVISMLPQNILFIPALIVGAAAAFSFSLVLLRRFFNSGTRVWPSFAGYTTLMLAVVAVFALAALTEAYLTPEITRYAATFVAR